MIKWPFFGREVGQIVLQWVTVRLLASHLQRLRPIVNSFSPMLALAMLMPIACTGNTDMSAQNPFQIPDCFKQDLEFRRRERFKKTVVTAVIVSAALVVGLLIEGCESEKSQAGAAQNLPAGLAQNTPAAPVASPSKVAPSMNVPVQSSPAVATVSEKIVTPVAPLHATGGTIYIVVSGDTLSHIAKKHGTTITALKSANQLASDRIVVGQKLKIPAA